ncbi:hypothetical protein M3Y96_01081500 [Aphelenchoides besseyi]|nr:hypothetical protein M3Y96_01081500 [Aphelenchoides besseyi]
MIVTDSCEPPPSLAYFRVVAAGERFARLQWSPREVRRLNRSFHWELDWFTRPAETDAARIIFPDRTRTTLLNDLKDHLTYFVRLNSRSDCNGQKGSSVTLNFTTRPQEIYPKFQRAMPHEIALTVFVLFLWLLILRSFVKKYNKMTFVSPQTAIVNGRRYSESKAKSNDQDSVRRGSEVSAKSKASTKIDKFELLENVVSKWRSEAVLEGGRTLTAHDVALMNDRADAHSSMSADTTGKMSLLNPPGRRISTVTISTDVRAIPANNKKRSINRSISPIAIPISQSYPLFRKYGSGSVLNNSPCQQTSYEDCEYNLEAPPCSPNPMQEDEESDTELERCRLLAKLSGPRPSTTDYLQTNGTMKRKISEVLLGHAKVDIRSFRRKRAPKSSSLDAAQLEDLTPTSSRPVFDLPDIDSRESTPRPPPTVRTQNSIESAYFTAADVVIQIADVDEERV